MEIKEATFISSIDHVDKCPITKLNEFAFIGRSNVGKSSLINMLTNQKKLAKTSGRPGKTQTINHFLINTSWYLVDLPGYGYAKLSKTLREKISKMINNYILNRANLTTLFILIDSRLEPQKFDIDFINFIGENNIPIALIFTKCDKLSPPKIQSNIAAFKKELLKYWDEIPSIFLSSSETGVGKEKILNFIKDINRSVNIVL
ncbi:MAG: YihA family ribosome biogenesis GTP-binding protein [Bacteroidetes bacterium GWA2_30_7]|nr:MAG: YihA family ribosome biogenesis GTP-binding protein [Bacteroidetes bacterium GWA2_30_7]